MLIGLLDSSQSIELSPENCHCSAAHVSSGLAYTNTANCQLGRCIQYLCLFLLAVILLPP